VPADGIDHASQFSGTPPRKRFTSGFQPESPQHALTALYASHMVSRHQPHAAALPMPHRPISSVETSGAPASRIVHSRFDVLAAPPRKQLLAWRERVGHVIDVVPSRAQLELPFRGCIDRFDLGELVFTDCSTDELLLERSIARISRDNVRSFAFHLFLEGGAQLVAVHSAKRQSAPCHGGILALDMDQPVRMLRQGCRVITLFAPGGLLQEVFPDPAAIHGRVIGPEKPIARLIIERAAALARNIRNMQVEDANRSLRALAELLVAAFGQEAGLSGNTRAVARAAMFDQVRRYVHANLQDSELTPEGVLDALGLPRATMYRLFRTEGGLGAYIRHLRLRAAADDLVRFPSIPVKDIAYSVGFKSASDFTRAFRRAYEVAPNEIRLAEGPHPDVCRTGAL
jgi:AraC-like DNA-binding protein